MSIPRGICVCSGTIDPHGGSVALAVQRHNQTPEHVAWRGLQESVVRPCSTGCGTLISDGRTICRFCLRWRTYRRTIMPLHESVAADAAGLVPLHRPRPHPSSG